MFRVIEGEHNGSPKNPRDVRVDLLGPEMITAQEELSLLEAAMIVINSVATPEELAYPHLPSDEGADPPGYKHDALALFDRITDFPPEAMALLDGIKDDHLYTYILLHACLLDLQTQAHLADPDSIAAEVIKPVMKALFKDVPAILEIVDELDESQFATVVSYQAAVGERLDEKNGADTQNSVFFDLIRGRNVVYDASRKDAITGEVTRRHVFINGHDAQRRAALTNVVSWYVAFPRILRSFIDSGKKFVQCGEQ